MAVDQIGTKGLVDCSVAAADIAPGTITSAKLAGSIANAKLSNSSITVNGTSIALGASGAVPPVQWQSVVVSDGSTVTTMVAGRGYFVNNTSAAGIVKLPASATAGDIVSIKDYAGNFGTNSLTIQRNSHKIQGNTNDSTISTNRASITLVYVDATKGWLYTNESNVDDLQSATYIAATGGTVTTSSNDKIHTFTGDANFVVSSVGSNQTPSDNNNKVGYLVIAGGASGGVPLSGGGGGGGAGGYREGKPSADPYTAGYNPLNTPSPIAAPDGLTVTAQTYPVTVGGGGAAVPKGTDQNGTGNNGSNSVFSTITSAGGGYGHRNGSGAAGGSGGGAGYGSGSGGAGNTPPVSPPQGNPGADYGSGNGGTGGGGAGQAGQQSPNTTTGGDGGHGIVSHITGSPVQRAGGGGGSSNNTSGAGGDGGGGAGEPHPSSPPNASQAGTANTGGGSGGVYSTGGGPKTASAGGSGVVIIRYKYQN